MGEFWNILGLEPTRDTSAIRRAYAQRTKTCHPEEDPEGFLELRKAYQAALAYAEQTSADLTVTNQRENFGEEFEEEEVVSWSIPEELPEAGENPFRDGDAILQFMNLYTGKQRKNSKLWMDYFTSDTFLEVAWNGLFTALMLEKVTEVEQDLPPTREFMTWLSVAYQFSVEEEIEFDQEELQIEKRGRQIELYPNADFSGMESILRIAERAPLPKRFGGDESAILESFNDYHHLVRLAESGSWNEQAMEEFQWIAGRYSSSYIRERCDLRTDSDYQRHPAGLRVFIHFFKRCDLPEELYRIVWQKFGLKSANMGRAKIHYGTLRELVLERIPGIGDEEPENFLKLNEERNACFDRIRENPGQEERELTQFFAKESMQKALRSRRFVEEQLLSCSNWLNRLTPEGVLQRLIAFYQENRDIPGWERVVAQATVEMENRAEVQRRREEEAHSVSYEELDLSLLLKFPERVYAQFLTGRERIYKPISGGNIEGETEETDKWWEYLKEDANVESAELLTKEELLVLFDQFAEGRLMRLELEFGRTTLVLTSDKGKYACFCFEMGDVTWFSMLSEPEVYQIVDSKDVKYLPFGMGKLASYNIHEKPFSIMRNLNLVFMQIGRGRIEIRMGKHWLWSSHTDRHNGEFKKRMAMQKLAKVPVRGEGEYILSKFVFNQYPACVESVTLTGDRTLDELRPGCYSIATAALAQFFQKKLAKLRLSWEFKGAEGDTGRQHIILLQDDDQFMMAWLEDGREQARFYASDSPCVFGGRVYPACLVHQSLKRIRNGLDLLLDDMSCSELVTGRTGEFVPADGSYTQVRAEFVDEQI